MRSARLVTRASCLAVVTAGFALLLCVGLPAAALRGRSSRWKSWVMHRWSRTCLPVFGLRVRVEGTPPLAPFLLVSNHLSYLDITLLSSQTACRFVSKAEVARWPVIGVLSRLAGTLFLDRERRRDVVRVGGEMRAALDEGSGVVLFPEGTSTMGARVLPFRSSLLAPASAQGLPVHVATIRYETAPEDPPAHLSVAWWGDMEFLSHVRGLLQLSRIEGSVRFAEAPLRGTDRKDLAARLQCAVVEGFEPMTSEAGAAQPLAEHPGPLPGGASRTTAARSPEGAPS